MEHPVCIKIGLCIGTEKRQIYLCSILLLCILDFTLSWCWIKLPEARKRFISMCSTKFDKQLVFAQKDWKLWESTDNQFIKRTDFDLVSLCHVWVKWRLNKTELSQKTWKFALKNCVNVKMLLMSDPWITDRLNWKL